MDDIAKKTYTLKSMWLYAVGVVLTWSMVISLSLLWHHKTMIRGALDAARIEARVAFFSHVIYRSWNADHGGLYAPVTPNTRPNPYLDTPDRDIQTPSGILLTKINPAFMTRQVTEMAQKKFGRIAHITSLNPIRPENRADDWEKKALHLFEQGKDEVSSMEKIHGKDYMRLMRPLITEQGCLSCHAEQGYKKGDIRGGISVAVPMEAHLAIEAANMKNFTFIYVFLWVAGLAGTLFFMSILNRQMKKRIAAEKQLRASEKLEGVIEMARAVCHELNQPLQMILGNSEIIMMDDIDKETLLKRVKLIKEQTGRMGEMTRKLIKIANYETREMPQGKVIDINKSSR